MTEVSESKRKVTKIFDHDYITDLASRCRDESGLETCAFFTTVSKNQNHLVIIERDDFERSLNVRTYLFPEDEELYIRMDETFDMYTRTSVIGGEFNIAWTSMLEVLNDFLLLDDTEHDV